MENKITRRNLLKGMTASAVLAAGHGVLSAFDAIANAAETGIYTPGTYSAKATGIGKITVSMTFDANSITDVQLDVSGETESIGQAAKDELISQIMTAQSSEIDGVSGATVTATAVREAAANCIAQAKGEAVETQISVQESKNEDWLGEAPVIDEAEIKETIEADIVVMGGGNAGAMCAFAAAENGASVAVIESQAEETIFYYGLHDIAAINSEFALKQGAPEIRKSEFLGEFQRRSHNRTNPRIVKKYIDNSGEMIDWLVAHSPKEVVDAMIIHNLNSNKAYQEMGSEVNRFTSWPGTVQMDFNSAAPTLIAEAESKGAKWYWETTGIVLVTEQGTTTEKAEQTDENGVVTFYDKEVPQTKVTGVIAKNKDGEYIKFVGKKGVVVSGGGYGGNSARSGSAYTG